MEHALERLADSLSRPLDDYQSVIPVFVSPFLAAADIDPVDGLEFIAGAISFQEKIRRDESKHFKGVILKVKSYSRKSSSGFLLGSKAMITLRATSGTNGEVQEISTGWTSYNGGNPEEYAAWQVAHSRMLEKKAEGLIGEEVLFQKVIESVPGDKKRARFVASLTKIGGGQKSGASKNGDRSADGTERLVDDVLSLMTGMDAKASDSDRLDKIGAFLDRETSLSESAVDQVLDDLESDGLTKKTIRRVLTKRLGAS